MLGLLSQTLGRSWCVGVQLHSFKSLFHEREQSVTFAGLMLKLRANASVRKNDG